MCLGDIRSLSQSRTPLVSSQEREDRGAPCMSSALPRTNKRNNLAQTHTSRGPRGKNHNIGDEGESSRVSLSLSANVLIFSGTAADSTGRFQQALM